MGIPNESECVDAIANFGPRMLSGQPVTSFIFRGLFSGLMVFCMVAPAVAADGVFEIYQACAENTGCFTGDESGFPVRISETGSYRLTSDLVVADENTNGIVVLADGVSIDLNGFGIFREGCQGSCEVAVGTGVGVRSWDPGISPGDPSSDAKGLSVQNGSVSGMGDVGIMVWGYGKIRNVRAHQNGNAGVSTSVGAIVTGNTAFENGGAGISAGAGAVVANNAVYKNQGDGIYAATGAVVLENSSFDNLGDGIQVAAGALVSGNSVRKNDGYGLRLEAEDGEDAPGYIENVIGDNTAGPVTGGVDAGGNTCGLAPCS